MIDFGVRFLKKHELLVPVGNMECLRQAVFNGCDAVYLAGKNFGARKFAVNFSNEELVEAIRFCHLYGVRIYITMNTLIHNSEVDSFLEQVRFLHKNGVDALIVQDFGMICLLREKFPNLEIHASTQTNVSSKDICRLFYELGVKRVVFSRELSIDEINSIDVPIEKEVFIHGALCISYSGECLMSSMLGGRSGNRGECAGSCRLKYSLYQDNQLLKNNQYLLSTKELNTSSEIERLLNSSIDSFKIEGRMKGPLYVGFITRFYRRLMDGENVYYEEELKKLKTIFNREFTKGRLFFASDQDLMNSKSPNHVGLEIGKVIQVTPKKIKIQLSPGCTLHQYDAIRFSHQKKGFIVNYLYDEKEKLVNSCSSLCYVDNKEGITEKDIVCKTQDYLLSKEFEQILPKKICVSFLVVARVGKPLLITIQDDHHQLSISSDIVLNAIHSPTTNDDITSRLSKLGNTPFCCNQVHVEMDSNIFIPVKVLNNVRRELVGQLQEIRQGTNPSKFLEKEVSFPSNSLEEKLNFGLCCSVYTREQLEVCLKNKVSRIYVFDSLLYDEYRAFSNVYFGVKRCSFDLKQTLKEKNLLSDYGMFSTNVYGNYPLNVTNIYTAYYLQKIGYLGITLSVELTDYEIKQFFYLYQTVFHNSFPFEVFSYGRVENMIIKGNILSLKKGNYYLEDDKN